MIIGEGFGLDGHELRQLLEAHRRGELSTDEALKRVRWSAPVEAAGNFAHLDTHRRLRCGFPEVVFGLGKTNEQILAIVAALARHGEGVLATRIGAESAAGLVEAHGRGEYNAAARTFWIAPERDPGPRLGKVVVVTAGTSDLPVAEEARVTASAWNCEVSLISDVGVAGVHRLLGKLDQIVGSDAIVCVAGMEGALPSVVGGLVDCPVVAVPTSIGYGAHLHGLASLLAMLNSCSSNVVVVNIDSGFNGGYVAGLIARRAGQARETSQA